MIFQDPMTSLNPVHKIGAQIVEQIQAHERRLRRRGARPRRRAARARRASRARAERVDSYPHEFSGGMRQRVMIAMALSCDPAVLIADEPTTALDVTIQAQILEVIKELRERTGTAIILVTHDLGVVADIADRIAVMYAGRIVETGTLDEIFYDPQHPYTWGLLGSITRIDRPRPDAPAVDPGHAAVAHRPARGLPLPPALPRTSSARARSTPRLESRIPEAPGHDDRCWLPVARSAQARQTAGPDRPRRRRGARERAA